MNGNPFLYIKSDIICYKLHNRPFFQNFYSLVNPILVEFMILPKGFYHGGGYGTLGGYDIALARLESWPYQHKIISIDPLSSFICLPVLQTPAKDINIRKGIIAGYGRSNRAVCEVGRHGPDKYEYCEVKPKCFKDSLVRNLDRSLYCFYPTKCIIKN